jgi:hypothetical protein
LGVPITGGGVRIDQGQLPRRNAWAVTAAVEWWRDGRDERTGSKEP